MPTDDPSSRTQLIMEIHSGVAVLKAQGTEHSRQLETLFRKVDSLSVDGCAIGKKHGEAIEVLQKRRNGTSKGNIIAALLSVIGALVVVIYWLVKI